MAVTVASLEAKLSLNKSGFDKGLNEAKGGLTGLVGKLGGVASGAAALGAGAAIGGVVALGAGIGVAAKEGLGMNKAMEDVTARLNAFTKDGEKSAEILQMIQERAAKTPFAFSEMAEATANLLPAAKQSGVAIEDLIAQAEILAASNPAQGLEGAAFSLREALSGDYTSIIERFNLSRSAINDLKDEGVPAMQVVGQAMEQMGLDADLVSGLAETAGGRWSTLLDTFTNLAATITAPIFDALSEGMGTLNQWLSDNQPMLQAFAELMVGKVKEGIKIVADFFVKFQETAGPAMEIIVDALNRIGVALGISSGEADGMDMLMGLLDAALWALSRTLDAVVIGVEAAAVVFELLARGVEQGRENFDFMKNAVQGAYDWVKKLIDDGVAGWTKFYDALVGIKDIVVDIATNAFGRLGDAMAKIGDTLPDWLIPGSPTPFEMGLKGIKKAIVGMPELSLSAGISPVPGAPAGTTNNYNFGGFSASVNTNQDGGSEAIRLIMQMLQAELAR